LDKNFTSNPRNPLYSKALKFTFQLLLPLVCGFFLWKRFEQFPLESLQLLLLEFPLLIFSFAFLMVAVLNWLLDSALWRQFFPDDFKPSLKSLVRINIATSSFGFFTPFQMGEYLGKSLYFPALSKKRNYAITFFFRTAKVYIKLFLGGIGLFLIGFQSDWPLWILTGITLLTTLVGLGYIFQDQAFWSKRFFKRWIKNPAIQKSLEVRTPAFRTQTFLLASTRILLNTFQFLAVCYFLMPVHPLAIFPQVLIFYSIATFIPSAGFLDPVIKSTLSLFLVANSDALALEVIFATNFVWFFNVGLAAIAGSLLHSFRRQAVLKK
jgi:hypothetical protein